MHLIYIAYEEQERQRFQSVASACLEVNGVHLCADAEEAMEWMQQHAVDMVWVHCRTSEERDAAKVMIAQHAGLPVVIVAADGRYALDAWQMQASGYILIPYAVKDLQQVIRKYKYLPSFVQRVEIQTIPSFAVSVDGQPLHISAAKPRELFCLAGRPR